MMLTGQLKRVRRLVMFEGYAGLPSINAEDIVIQKLRLFDLGGRVSDRQWRDRVSVLRFADEFDLDCVRDLSNSIGLSELLDQARADANDF